MNEKANVFRYSTPFTMVSNELILCENMSPTLKTVYSVICCYANIKDSSCYPSYATIAKKAGISRRTAITAIQTLQDCGLLEKETRKNGSDYTSNVYVIFPWNEQAARYFSAEPGEMIAPPSEMVAPGGGEMIAPPGEMVAPKQKSINKNYSLNKNHSFFPTSEANERNEYAQLISENLEIEYYRQGTDKEFMQFLETCYALILDTVCTSSDTVRVAKQDKPREVVRSQLLKLTDEHIAYVFYCFEKNSTDIKDTKVYLLTALYNAPFTMDVHWQQKYNHDFGGGLCDSANGNR